MNAKRPSPTVAGAIIETIHGYGVDTAFGIPGTHNIELYRALDELGFRLVTTRHEQGAGYAADGWAQRTRRPGLVVTTSGPGLLNALSPMASAFCESRPMIVLSPGAPLGSDSARDGSLHETHNAVQAVASLIRSSSRVSSGEEAVEAVHRAFSSFANDRPGPVHIEIPLDVLESEHILPTTVTRPRLTPPQPTTSPQALSEALALITRAHQPIMVVGGGAIDAHRHVLSLAERIGIPVLTTVNGKGVIPESHPLSLGPEWRLPGARSLLAAADLLIIVGSKLGLAETNGELLAPSGRTVRIDIDPQQVDINLVPDVPLVGDARIILGDLLRALPADFVPIPAEDRARIARRALRNEARALAPSLAKLNEAVASALPPGTVVTGDSSQVTYMAGTTFIPADEPAQFLFMPAFSTLGYGLPAAIGAKVASPDAAVVCVVGDGALMFALQELMTVIEQKLSIVVICIDNGGYGEISENMTDRGITPRGVKLDQPDWVLLAEAFGFDAYRTDDDNLTAVVAAAITSNRASFIHHRLPPSR